VAPATVRGRTYRRRLWSVRHARGLAAVYRAFETLLRLCAPVLRPELAERPTAAVERTVKGLLFDCRMCGQCALSSTGLSCPMNCPKGLRNGPCGGVRSDGACEVIPDMPCVWAQAYEGARRLQGDGANLPTLAPIDNRLWGRSSWRALARG
jgi:hypothetical protein